MQDEPTYVSGLEMKANESGGFTLTYNRKRFPEPINFGDLQYILKTESKSGIKKAFDSFFQILDQGIDIEEARKEVSRQARQFLPDVIKEKARKEEELPVIESWDAFKEELESYIQGRTEDFLFVLSVIVSYWHADKECIYVLLLAPRGSGKSSLLNCFEGCNDVVLMDDWTMESLAPGTAQADQEVKSLLDLTEDKTLLMHDMTTLLRSHPNKVRKQLANFTQSFGKQPLRKFSPSAGKKEFGGGWNGIFGITPRLFHMNLTNFINTGRFLVYKLSSIDQAEIIMNQKNHPDYDSIRKACKSFLAKLKQELPEIHISDDIRQYIVDFLKMYVQYLLVFDGTYHQYEPEGIIRRFNQIEMLMKAKVHIEGRKDATIEDANFFLRMLWIEQDKQSRLAKLKQIPTYNEDWDEFTLL
ncbi:MAG: hypothetical protein BAJALOKI1v1_590020 [Promethearchaeota archaeon]|nr:MAG: hypothetical protein BAJALOKI1v1_590020 [Candidatus Lokiarchaeota archaeon]